MNKRFKLLAVLAHPNICAVHGIHQEQGQTFHCDGLYRGAVAGGQDQGTSPLPLPEALDIAIQIAAGLSAVPDRISLCGPQANDS